MNANYEYFRRNRENLPLPIQMKLSEKPKTFGRFFITFFGIYIKFWTCWKKVSLIAQVFLNYWLRKTCLLKCIKCLASENFLAVNVLKCNLDPFKCLFYAWFIISKFVSWHNVFKSQFTCITFFQCLIISHKLETTTLKVH